MIDTIVLAGLTHPTLRNLPPSGPLSVEKAETQWEWIEQTLSSSTADWIIVAGHYPGTFTPKVSHCVHVPPIPPPSPSVWSIAEHGPTKVLVELLRPKLQKYNVTA